MKIPLFVLLMVSISSAVVGQDLSSFYAISGFRLPALRPGQYYLSLSPRYSSRPSDNSSASSLALSGGTNINRSTGEYTYSTFGVSTNFTYGISDKTTISLGLQYNPNQTSAKQTYTAGSAFPPLYSSSSTVVEDFKEELVASSFVLSHRVQSNIECSVSASWSSYQQPGAGTQSQSSTSGGVTTTSSGVTSLSSSQHSFDINATIVILGR